jgi:hypothetical protein
VHIENPEYLGLAVSGLCLALDAVGQGLRLAVPPCYTRFVRPDASGKQLTLNVRDGAPAPTYGWQSVFYDADTWQLWRDLGSRLVFTAPKHCPPRRQLTVEATFGTGHVIGEFSANCASGQTIYPLQNMDFVLYANWLAEYGDLILHACGVDDSGAGFAFLGAAGAGKSTLASAMAVDPSITVLGEDNVIVRCIDGHWLLYGTPWHTNPARCAPGGVPLRNVFFLDRAAAPGIRTIGCRDGIRDILQNSFIPYYSRVGVGRILDSLSHLAEQIPFHSLSYRLGSDVLRLIRGA